MMKSITPSIYLDFEASCFGFMVGLWRGYASIFANSDEPGIYQGTDSL